MSYWPVPLLILAADFSLDGAVGSDDLIIMLDQWGRPGPTDLNGDGVVNSPDMSLLMSVWGGKYGDNDIGDGATKIVPTMNNPQWGPSPFPGYRRLTYVNEQGDLVAIDELIE